MARPRRARITRASEDTARQRQADALDVILDGLMPYLADAAEVLGQAVKKDGDKKAAEAIIKLVVEHSQPGRDDNTMDILRLISRIRSEGDDADEEEIPPAYDIEAELEDAARDYSAKPQD